MDKIIVKTKMDRKLYVKFLRKNTFKSASTYFFIAAALLSIYFAISNTIQEDVDESTYLISWAFAIIITLSIPFFTISKYSTAAARNARERQDSLEIIEFTKAKITRFIEGVEGKIIFGWDRFDSVYEYEDHIFLYLDKETGLFFSKDTIVEGDLEAFRKLAKKNLTPSKKGKVKYFTKFKES